MPIERTRYPGIGKYKGPRGTKFVVDYRDVQRKKRRLTCGSLKEAITLRSAKQKEPGGDPKRSFGDWARSWLKSKKPPVTRIGTYRFLDSALRRHILPAFGSRRIEKIVSDEVENFLVERLSQGFAKNTVGNLQSVLSGIFKYAMRHDAGFAKNPALGMAKELNLKKDVTRGVRALQTEELRGLLEAAKAIRPRVYVLLLTMARAGLRVGEAVALRWTDLDFDERLIRVERRHEFRTPAELKTKRSRREVDMSLQLREELGRLKRLQLKDKLKFGWPELPIHCFVMPSGHPILAQYVARNFPLLLKNAKIPLYNEDIRLSPHCLRHTFACHLLQAGYSPSYVQDQLGHHSISMTKDLYGHWFPARNKEAVDSLDDYWEQGKLLDW